MLELETEALRLPNHIKKAITTDSARNMVSGRRLENFVSQNCCNHILQLALNDAKNEKNEEGDLVNQDVAKAFKAAVAMSAFSHKSSTFHRLMKKFCRRNGHRFTRLKGFSKVRWNSEHSMVKRLCEHKMCILQMEEANICPNMPVVELANWRCLKLVLQVLRPFEDTTKVWEADKEPTMTTVGEELYTLQQKLLEFSRTPMLEGTMTFVHSLLRALEKRFPMYGMSSDLPAWGNLLNPRLKVRINSLLVEYIYSTIKLADCINYECEKCDYE